MKRRETKRNATQHVESKQNETKLTKGNVHLYENDP